MSEPVSYDAARMACAICSLAGPGVAWCSRCEALVKTPGYLGLTPLELIPRTVDRRQCFGCTPRTKLPIVVADLLWCERCTARAVRRRPVPRNKQEHPPEVVPRSFSRAYSGFWVE
jgi:hypothetical protein